MTISDPVAPVILNSFQDPGAISGHDDRVDEADARAWMLRQVQHDDGARGEEGFTPLRRSAEHGFTPLKRSAENGFTPLRRSAENGFTLVELMVVIVILGLLAALVAFNVLPSGDRARVVKAQSDIAAIESSLEMYKLQNFNYPSTSDGLQALVAAPPGLADPSRYQKGGYIRKLPADPWGNAYLYAAPGTHGEIDVWSYGADGKEGGEGNDADIGNWK